MSADAEQDWTTVLDDGVENRSLTIQKHRSNGFFRVRARQDERDDGTAYQDGRDFVHVAPSSSGEPAEGEASSRHALRATLGEMHFSDAAIDDVLERIGQG